MTAESDTRNGRAVARRVMYASDDERDAALAAEKPAVRLAALKYLAAMDALNQRNTASGARR